MTTHRYVIEVPADYLVDCAPRTPVRLYLNAKLDAALNDGGYVTEWVDENKRDAVIVATDSPPLAAALTALAQGGTEAVLKLRDMEAK